MKSQIQLSVSLALITALGFGFSGCGGSSGGTAPSSSTASDVTVERGKVYNATVVDSSTPVQTAKQKANLNIYTFASAPTYPIVVTGGWIDVNANGKKDTNDTNLDITMKSFSKVVTPVTTYIADANVTLREQKLAALKARLNASGVGSATLITDDDLLGLPSTAKNLDFIVLTNAIYKDMKEHGGSLDSSDDDSVMSQFSTVAGLTLSKDPEDIEAAVIANLEGAGFAEYISASEIPDDDSVDDDTGVSTGDDSFLSTKGTLYIYNNAGSDVNNLSTQLGMELYNASSPLHCINYGFSNIITEKDETDGTHVITYFSDDNQHMCSEFDYAASSSNSGSTNIALYNN